MRIWRRYSSISAKSAFLLLLLSLAQPAIILAEPLSEYTVKVGFIANFLKLIELPDKNPNLELCVSADSEVLAEFASLSDGEPINDRKIQLHDLSKNPTAPCSVMFIARSSAILSRTLLNRYLNRPVLTIGDDPEFVKEGGIIGFVNEDSKIRFEINLAVAKRESIQISARLLRLAKNIEQ